MFEKFKKRISDAEELRKEYNEAVKVGDKEKMKELMDQMQGKEETGLTNYLKKVVRAENVTKNSHYNRFNK